MKKIVRGLSMLLIVGLTLSSPLSVAGAALGDGLDVAAAQSDARSIGVYPPLVPQALDYTENPVDVPNPDRGFYRANDGMVVPVSGVITGNMNVGSSPVTVGGASMTTRISHVYFDLQRFSSNAFTGRGTRYNASYRAPAGQVGTGAPYATHFDYWQANVLPTWPKGTSQPLTATALAYIRDKLEQVRAGNGVTLVRFSYDGPGYGWVDVEHPVDGYVDRLVADIEPDKATMLGHIAQLKPILAEYEDVLMGVDGGMFGPWGEMHSTTFGTSTEANAWLLDAWLDAVPESRSITVQGGAFLSWYNNHYGTQYTFADIDSIPAPQPGTPEARFGFFNDSYGFGEDEGDDYPNDWGSLSEGAGWPGDPLGAAEDYDRGRIMTWIRNQNNFYGGEAQGGKTLWNTYPFVAWEASYAQTVYLNADYSSAVHNRWRDFTYNEANVSIKMKNAYVEPYKTEYAIFDPVYAGRTGAEYWRDRLGYRLVLRDANASEWVEQNGALSFAGKLQNVGFGNIVNYKAVSVILKPKDVADTNIYRALTTLDARDWRPDLDSRADNTAAWRDLEFTIDLSVFDAPVPVGDYDIYLKINDPLETHATKRSIQFANHGIWDDTIGANRIGSTAVRAVDSLLLQDLIDAADGMNAAEFTAESWAVFADALADAKQAVATADPAALEQAYDALKAAMQNLVAMLPMVSLDRIALVRGETAQFNVWMGMQENKADRAEIVSSDASVIIVSTDELEQDGIVTATAVNAGTAEIEVTFYYEDGGATTAAVQADADADVAAEAAGEGAEAGEAAAATDAGESPATAGNLDGQAAALAEPVIAAAPARESVKKLIAVTGTEDPSAFNALARLIATANTKRQSEYTAKSWSAFAAALANAKTVAPDETAELVNQARQTLQTAMDNLVRATTSSSKSSSTTTPAPSRPTTEAVPVGPTPLDVATAVSETKQATTGDGIFRFKDKSTVTLEAMEVLANAGARRVNVDAMAGSAVELRISFDPAQATKAIDAHGTTSQAKSQARKVQFEKWFSNKFVVIALGQEGNFGMAVNIAAKVDLTGMDTENLYIYSYNRATNSYARIQTDYRIDANGYLHFTTELGGDIVISDGALVRK